jgi:hypothetical protein
MPPHPIMYPSPPPGSAIGRAVPQPVRARQTATIKVLLMAIDLCKWSLDDSTVRAFQDIIWPLICCRDIIPIRISLRPELFLNQRLDGMEIDSASRGSSAEVDEILRIDFDGYDDETMIKVVSFFLESVIPPFIKGVGNICCRQRDKSLIILLAD